MTLFLIFGGSIEKPDNDFFIAGEIDILMSISGGIIEAVGP